MVENRHSQRKPCAYPAAVDGPRGKVRGTCINLSMGGALIDGVHLTQGTNVTVNIDIAGHGTLSARAEVKHSANKQVGLAFVRLEQHQQQLLQTVVESLTT